MTAVEEGRVEMPPAPLHSQLPDLSGLFRGAQRLLAKLPPARMALAVPRTLEWAAQSWLRRGPASVEEGPPRPKVSLGLAAQVAVDESMLMLAMAPSRFPHRDDYLRGGLDITDAYDFYRERGWLDAPLGYHRDPPPLGDDYWIRPTRTLTGVEYEHLSFESGYEPYPGEPGGERWRRLVPNRTAHVWVMRHADDEPRPWLVCLHGFMMGIPPIDLLTFRARRLFTELGVNIAVPVLPLHGPRKIGVMGGDGFMTYDLINAVYGLTQSIWDIRRVIGWIRAQDPTAIGVHGISLGGCVTGLIAGLEPGLDCVVAGVPVCDIPDIFGHHSPRVIRERSHEHGILGPASSQVCSVVSPLTFEALLPRSRRFIYAGLGDRMTTPAQAHKLWLHWDQPAIHWYPGNHAGFLWGRGVEGFVRQSLVTSGICLDPDRTPDTHA
ncbi:MAG: alpha/beta hydrolase [Acidimicrobiia bacterium]|nr:alpha/beta hydrolase [Acidimicrobiia bacterium]